VVLYLVDASQSPQDVGYLDAELQLLALAGKPALELSDLAGETWLRYTDTGADEVPIRVVEESAAILRPRDSRAWRSCAPTFITGAP